MDGYYQGILQVRPCSPDIFSYIEKQVQQAHTHLSDIKKKKEGVDFYFVSKNFIIVLAKKLQKQFGGTISLSKKLHTKNRTTGKLVYRITILFRVSPFRVGSVVSTEHELLKVTSVGKNIRGISVLTNKKKVIKIAVPVDTMQSLIVATHPSIYVLHPTTYQPVSIANDFKGKINQVVTVAFFKNNCYVIT